MARPVFEASLLAQAGPSAEDVATPMAATEIPLRSWQPPASTNLGRWSFAFGVGTITDTTPGDYLSVDYERYKGRGGGLTYNLTAAYQAREFAWRLGRTQFRPTIELPFMLTLVDEDDGGFIPDLNLGAMGRWRDFPWNRWLYTTFAIGGGLSYSPDVWTADQHRHLGEDRSRLKFWMPIEFTFALPRHPRHQLMLFIDHQSGGQIFDRGGVDAWGLGYRFML